MKQQVFGPDAVIGKTIEQIISPQTGPTLIVFTDGTFVQLSVHSGQAHDPMIVWNEPFDRRDFPTAKLVAAGVMTAEDVMDAEAPSTGREAQRREYEQLRAEFEHEG